MSRPRFYTNGIQYTGSEIREARTTLGIDLYNKYSNFGPALTDNHAGSFPAIEQFVIGNWVYESYEYECMSLSLGGGVSAPSRQRALRFYPVDPNCEYSGLPSPAAYKN
jgi:hypothetical protein